MREVCDHHPKIKFGSADLEVKRRSRATYYGLVLQYPGFIQLPLEGGYDGGRETRLFGFVLCKDSEFKEAFDVLILSMIETGVIKRCVS